MGGEKCCRLPHFVLNLGSPPRGRGKEAGIPMLAPVIGITPAWAGKRGFLIAESLIIWDHPRVGGEKILEPKRQTGLLGSPPRGRGKGAIQKGGVTHSRITPAWAGKSIVKVPLIIPVQDHPRVGGEKKAGE